MLIVLPYYSGDRAIAQKLVSWIYELEVDFPFAFITVRDSLAAPIEFPKNAAPGLKREIVYPNDGVNQWPFSPNRMLNRVCKEIEYVDRQHFLWLEPDCIVFKEGWADAINDAYLKIPVGKFFLGNRVEVADVPLHMSGVGVYPKDMTIRAGAATIATSIAWDIAGAHQIVPLAFWTDLIVHNWKHEPIDALDKLENLRGQHKNMVLFHSDKSGKAIDILREEKLSVGSGVVEAVGHDAPPTGTQPTGLNVTPRPDVTVERDQSEMIPTLATWDIFIKTYPPDYPWLQLCLQSIHEHVKGFGRIIVVAPDDKAPVGSKEQLLVKPEYDKNEEAKDRDGYLGQQIAKLYADLYSQSSFVMHVDSDVIFNRPTTLQDFLSYNRATWLYTPYAQLPPPPTMPWQSVTEKFMKRRVDYEFMRRAPQVIPRWLYPKLREFCYERHEKALSDYIWFQPHRHFSEFNAIGAYAYYYHNTEFVWVNTEVDSQPPVMAKQFRSYDGVDVHRGEIASLGASHWSRAGYERTAASVADGDAPESDGRKPKRKKRRKKSVWTPERREAARQRALWRHNNKRLA
jgi:hypothetical protein